MRLRGAYTEAAADDVTVLAGSGDSGSTNYHFNGSTYFAHRSIPGRPLIPLSHRWERPSFT